MFRKVESNYNKYNMNKRMLRKIQRFCEKIYSSMMHGHIFADFLNALRVELRADVGDRLFNNKTFQEKYNEYLQYRISHCAQQLKTPGVAEAQIEYMNLLVNYAVYRKLFQLEDPKTYQSIWALQKMAPLIVLYNTLSVQPGKFLAEVCPLKRAAKVDPPDIVGFVNQSLALAEQGFAGKVESYYIRLVQWITQMNSDNLKDSDYMR
jgi:hypothetical protein